ncbi:MAG: hypothetical protein AB8D78_07510 [Akkermansiaceae bacterium]
MSYNGNFNPQVFLKFLSRLIRVFPKKTYLIVENLRIHHAKPVKAWVTKGPEK